MRAPGDSFGDEQDPPMDRIGAMLFATAWLASWLVVWAVYRACVAVL